MASLSSGIHGPAPVPAMPQPSDASRIHTASLSLSSSSSGAGSDAEPERKTRADRPHLRNRLPSASILVPRDHPEIEIAKEYFPPDDARAMSPRRDSADVERLSKEARQVLQE
jgi:short coiled-coil protein